MLSIDNASTRDIDDALSFEFVQGDDMPTCRIGIHVADVAARVPTISPLFEWARLRASSGTKSQNLATSPNLLRKCAVQLIFQILCSLPPWPLGRWHGRRLGSHDAAPACPRRSLAL